MTIFGKVDYSKLFELSDPLADRPLRLEPEKGRITIEKANRLFDGECKPSNPVVLRAYMGGQATDFLWSGLPPILCISQKVVDLFTEVGFTGWKRYPVEVFDRKGELLPGYCGFAVTGKAGNHELERSQVIYRRMDEFSDQQRKYYRGFFFDESEWDDSDIFTIKDTSFIIVKRGVRDVLKHNRITNLRLTPLLEVEIDAAVFDYKK